MSRNKTQAILSKLTAMFVFMLAFHFLTWQVNADGTFVVRNTNDSGTGSLRQAILDANEMGGGTINFKKNVKETIDLLTALPVLNNNITINGPGAHLLTVKRVSSAPAFRIFEVTSNHTVSITGLTISGGSVGGNSFPGNSGGGIYNQGTLTISGCILSNNSASGSGILNSASGGGILNERNATLAISDSTLSGNTASHFGGGIWNMIFGTLIINNCTLSDNSSDFNGGGLYNDGTLTIRDSTLSGNSSDNSGGGIYCVGTLTIDNSKLSGNSSSFGGGIISYAKLTIDNSTLSGNSAIGGTGGGILKGDGMLTISNSTLSDNSAGFGGGIDNKSSGTLTIDNSKLSSNSATFGGGIFNQGTLTVSGSTLSDNSAIGGTGGGILNESAATLAISDSTLSGNTASHSGGAIVSSGMLTITGATIANNTASQGGGIANLVDLTVHLQSSIVAKNTGGSAPDISGMITSLGHNLIGDITSATGFDPSRGDLINVDPLLQLDGTGKPLLANNGGPTQTIALRAGSPALDHGKNPLLLPTDQRGPGFARTFDNPAVENGMGDGTDIGAFEAQNISITNIVKNGKHLLISGAGFQEGAKIFVDGVEKKTIYESPTSLIGKKAAKGIASGVKIKVRNPDGTESNEWTYQ
jgi:predicted outer membrane repeat protein